MLVSRGRDTRMVERHRTQGRDLHLRCGRGAGRRLAKPVSLILALVSVLGIAAILGSCPSALAGSPGPSSAASAAVTRAEDMPTTTVTGMPDMWTRRPVTLTFTGQPGPGGSPVVKTEYQVNGAAWTEGNSLTISAEGTTSVACRSTNAAGITENPPTELDVRIDMSRPRAAAKATVIKGRTGTFRFRVSDKVAGTVARIDIWIVNSRHHTMAAITTSYERVNRWHSLQLHRENLTPGRYTVVMRAVDMAGNRQAKTSSAQLIVR